MVHAVHIGRQTNPPIKLTIHEMGDTIHIMSTDTIIEQFKYILSERGIAKDTKAQYVSDVRTFLRDHAGVDEDGFVEAAKDYIANIDGDVADGTIRRRKSAVSLLGRECFGVEVEWDKKVPVRPERIEPYMPTLPNPDSEWDWRADGVCVTEKVSPHIFYPKNNERDINRAKRVCNRCPVKDECLDFAVRNLDEHGVWGGTSEAERWPLIKAYKAHLKSA